MRFLIVTLCCLMLLPTLPAGGDAAGKRHERVTTITVRDSTGGAWPGVVSETIDRFNAAMPPGGPELIYRSMPEQSCDAVKRRENVIAVCLTSWGPAERSGRAMYRQRGQGVLLINRDVTAFPHNTVCHELMHLLTDINDIPKKISLNDDLYFGQYHDGSCVWGMRDDPGPFDIEQLARVYGKRQGKR